MAEEKPAIPVKSGEKSTRIASRPDRNEYKHRRLFFIWGVMDLCDMTLSDLARQAGLSYQSLRNPLVANDDCMLSRAEELMQAMGYSLKMEIAMEEPQRRRETIMSECEGENASFEVEGFPPAGKAKPDRELPPFLKDYPLDRAVRLAPLIEFLSRYIARTGKSLRDIQRGAAVPKMYYTLSPERDDIMVSHLYSILKYTGAKLKWKITPKDE